MNYANMIEEKNLKKTFIIATLCSTLVGTFTSSIGLYDRVAARRAQKKTDTSQNDEIKKLREQVEASEKRSKQREESSRERRPRDEFSDSLERSTAMIQREYDEGYGRLGRRYAVGDAITENKLQAQIIALQQTVIQVLQDALVNDRQLSRADVQKLVAASQAAREGSLDALRGQYQRLAVDGPSQRALPPPKRASTVIETQSQRGLSPPKRASTVIDSDSIFCRYSLDLQYIPNKALSAAFAPGQVGRCPTCDVRLDIDPSDFWQIGKRIPVIVVEGRYEKEAIEDRQFHLGQRFVVKCHTTDGEYACVLCSKHRDVDVLCGSVETLVNHVGRAHDVSELEQEIDLWEKSTVSAALPDREIREVREKRLALPEYR